MFENIKTIASIQDKPEFILVDCDFDVLHTLCNIGLINSEYDNEYDDPDAWQQFYACEYGGLFIVLDDSGANYLAVFGYWGSVPYLDKSLELLWYNGELKV